LSQHQGDYQNVSTILLEKTRDELTYTTALVVEVIALLAVVAGLNLWPSNLEGIDLDRNDLDSSLRSLRRTITRAIVTALLDGLAHLTTARDNAGIRVEPAEPGAHALVEPIAALLALGASEDGVDVGIVGRGILGSCKRSGCDHDRGRGGEKEGAELHDEERRFS
jgi:hypothetical protein